MVQDLSMVNDRASLVVTAHAGARILLQVT
jgi:hypothetical protein